jgi:hypothetical protein
LDWNTKFESNPGLEEGTDAEYLRYLYEGIKIEMIFKRKFMMFVRPYKFPGDVEISDGLFERIGEKIKTRLGDDDLFSEF